VGGKESRGRKILNRVWCFILSPLHYSCRSTTLTYAHSLLLRYPLRTRSASTRPRSRHLQPLNSGCYFEGPRPLAREGRRSVVLLHRLSATRDAVIPTELTYSSFDSTSFRLPCSRHSAGSRANRGIHATGKRRSSSTRCSRYGTERCRSRCVDRIRRRREFSLFSSTSSSSPL